MGKKLAFWIEVEIVETGAVPSLDRCPQEQEDGSFSLVLSDCTRASPSLTSDQDG
jgi:hypothetical protein